MDGVFLHAPEPSQNIHSENGNSGSSSDAGQRFLCAWFTVRKTIAANDNRNQACDFGNGSGEEGLKSGKARVEWRAALCHRDHWHENEKRQD
jgi:hypothetical protein